MEGVVELAEEIFHMPVRLGTPKGILGLTDAILDPVYSTGVGLLLYGQKELQEKGISTADTQNESIFQRVKQWVKGNF